MKLFFNIAFILVVNLVFSQTRIAYVLEMKYPDQSIKKFNMNLDIIDHKVKFYDDELLNPIKTVSKSNQLIIRDVNSNKNTMIVFTTDNKALKINSEDQIAWNLLDEYKQVKEYKLQKAIAQFGDRNWIAWFCSDVNINEGPFKFNGLPGLVFELEDADHIFQYHLASISKLLTKDKTYRKNYDEAPLISWEKYNKNLSNFFDDPYNKERLLISSGNEININDKDVKLQNLNTMTKEFQKLIKSTFPPAVELHKFTFYKQRILNLKTN